MKYTNYFIAGDAVICGESITTNGGMDRVRQIMGVCPQFDVQYDRLTGREHLELYASIKGSNANLFCQLHN